MAKNITKLARRYARALFESYSVSDIGAVNEAMTAMATIWSSNKELVDVVRNPALAAEVRSEILGELGSRVKNNDPLFRNFFSLLVQNERAELIPQIATDFAALYLALQKILSVEVVASSRVTAEERVSLQRALEQQCGATLSIEWHEDKNLIGGMIIRAGDRVLDGSVRGTLERIRHELLA